MSMGPPARSHQPVVKSQVFEGATDGPSRLSGGMNAWRHSSVHQPSKYQADE